MINEAIRELVAENFDNYDHAVAWWSKNRPRFDDLLTPIE